ncbi:MAG: hypothetical protein ISR34_11420 [Pirellulales bacterium]|nr:hypothetical protein [Pirellulales bacterium]
MATSEILAALGEYLQGGEQQGFGSKDPWAGISGEGGLEALLEKLAMNVTNEQECPDEDCALSAMQMGTLAASANLNAKESTAIRIYMMIAYNEHVSFYREGLASGKSAAEETKTKMGAHGGTLPAHEFSLQIEQEKGMPWQAVVVVTSVMYRGVVPTATEIDKYGYGSDPALWTSTNLDRKAKKKNFNDYLQAMDSIGYRDLLLKGATRMSQNKAWAPYAATLMLFVNKLSSMTFDQNRGDLFLKYCEEHMEAHKGEGLYNAVRPTDPQILEETVLSQKNAPKASETEGLEKKMDKRFEEAQATERSLKDMLRAEQVKSAEMKKKMETMERSIQSGVSGGEPPKVLGPPGPNNPCNYCGGIDHFARECPKKKIADEARAAKKKEAEKEE